MSTDPMLRPRNAESRQRLTALVGRLTDADLERSVGHGWTVADALVHLAFWDLRAVELMDRYEKSGVTTSPADPDVVNDTVHTLGRAIPPRTAARLAVDAAEAVDRRVAALPDRVVEAIIAAGSPFSPERYVHWAEHLEEIERALPARK